MKKPFFYYLIAAALSGPLAHAQQAPNLRAQAVEDTRKLAQQIALDDARTTKVKNLTYERLVQENDLKQMYSIDPALLQNKLAVVEQAYAQKLQGVLTDAQFQRYTALKTAPVVAPTATATAAAPAPAPAVAPAPIVKPEAQAKPKPAPHSTTKKATTATHVSITRARH